MDGLSMAEVNGVNSSNSRIGLAVLCDFDGTVVTIDTAAFVLEEFAEGDWRVFGERFERGELTLEECLRKEFSTVRASRLQILDKVEGMVSARAGFGGLVRYCRRNAFPLILVSAGLDFVVERFLKQHRSYGSVRVCMPRTEFTGNGIEFRFPNLFFNSSVNFKDDLVAYHQKQGKSVVFIGDGRADYFAAKKADVRFAVKGSQLAELLRKGGIVHEEIAGFEEVVHTLSVVRSRWNNP